MAPVGVGEGGGGGGGRGGDAVDRWLERKSKLIDPIPWRFNIRCARP